jgi:hypothetical protein
VYNIVCNAGRRLFSNIVNAFRMIAPLSALVYLSTPLTGSMARASSGA